ncbi:MAG TPA: HAD family acid phosphatase [Solirubrobacterales bacterium]|nr:HAD family acid phosphatase [Solirubrobacterales bacterium]
MNNSLSGRSRPHSLPLFLPLALVASLLLALAIAGPAAKASASDYTPEERQQYFDSGKYTQDLDFVAAHARKFIIERTQPTIKIVQTCRAKGFRIGKKDPGVDPAADYTVPVTVPKSQLPDKIVKAPKAGLGPVTKPALPRVKYPKAKKAKRITKKRCANLPKLAIAMDLDETAVSTYLYGSNAPDYDAGEFDHLIAGDQTAIPQMLKLYRLAQKRGLATFAITARPDTAELRASAEANLKSIGYKALTGLYMRTSPIVEKGIIKNSQRAEIVKRRGYKIIAMFGDQNSDLRTGFYERGFKYQSAVTPEQD